MVSGLDHQPTPDIDQFLAAIAGEKDRGSVRLKVVSLDGKVDVITLRLDLQYWPTYALNLGEDGWRRTRLSSEPGRAEPR